MKNEYNFNPAIMTTDFNKAAYKAFKLNFSAIRMVPCFFHFFQRIYLKLPQLKDKNKNIKNLAKNLTINLKLLCFIDNNKIDTFFDKIEKKFRNVNKKFFDYFKKNYLINLPFSDRSWNYYTLYNNDDNKELYFFTNNICESANRIFNMHFISSRKSFYSFRKCLLETLDYFTNKDEYIEKGRQITRAFHKYVKEKYNHDRLPLITETDMKNILDDYENDNNIVNELNEEDKLSNYDIDYLINNTENIYSSSNYDSESSQ